MRTQFFEIAKPRITRRVSEFRGYSSEMTGKNALQSFFGAFVSYVEENNLSQAMKFYAEISEYFSDNEKCKEEFFCFLQQKIRHYEMAACFWELQCPKEAAHFYELLIRLRIVYFHLDQTHRIIHNSGLSTTPRERPIQQ